MAGIFWLRETVRDCHRLIRVLNSMKHSTDTELHTLPPILGAVP